jgi:hypothetical protein
VTAIADHQYAGLASIMCDGPIDFIRVACALNNRSAAREGVS